MMNNKVLLPIALFLFFLVVSSTFGPMINNGDYWRVTASEGFEIPARTTQLKDFYPFSHSYHYNYTTLGVIALAWAVILVDLGSSGFYTPLIFITLNLIFFVGVFNLVKRSSFSLKNAIAVFIFLAFYAVFGFYFKSFYEEAAILAITPWLYGGMQNVSKRHYLLFNVASVAVLLAKVQMIIMAPFLLGFILFYGDMNKDRKKVLFTCMLIILASFLSMKREAWVSVYDNVYNRYYNGIGWSKSDVYQWPVHDFNARRSYFEKNQAFFQQKTAPFENNPNRPLLGTSYWPTGHKLATISQGLTNTSEQKKEFQDIVDQGKLTNFIGFFIAHPLFLGQYLKNIYLTTMVSDYRLNYLRTQSSLSVLPKEIVRLDDFALTRIGYIYFIFAFVVIAIRPNFKKGMLAAYIFLGAPIVCVMGDGFFEFEKHMEAYFMLLPALSYLLLHEFAIKNK